MSIDTVEENDQKHDLAVATESPQMCPRVDKPRGNSGWELAAEL